MALQFSQQRLSIHKLAKVVPPFASATISIDLKSGIGCS
jgi:hypothetical protein